MTFDLKYKPEFCDFLRKSYLENLKTLRGYLGRHNCNLTRYKIVIGIAIMEHIFYKIQI